MVVSGPFIIREPSIGFIKSVSFMMANPKTQFVTVCLCYAMRSHGSGHIGSLEPDDSLCYSVCHAIKNVLQCDLPLVKDALANYYLAVG